MTVHEQNKFYIKWMMIWIHWHMDEDYDHNVLLCYIKKTTMLLLQDQWQSKISDGTSNDERFWSSTNWCLVCKRVHLELISFFLTHAMMSNIGHPNRNVVATVTSKHCFSSLVEDFIALFRRTSSRLSHKLVSKQWTQICTINAPCNVIVGISNY